ncbi:MAG: hypothetical protein ACRDOM_02190 [Nocardioides sp.]
MGEELQVSPATLARIRSDLGKGREALEGSASSAPSGIDAGEMTAMLTGMMSKVVDNAAAVSEALGGMSAQVSGTGAHFWEVDADVAADYRGQVPR